MGDEARMKAQPGRNASTESKICSLGMRVGGNRELLRHSPLRNGALPGGGVDFASQGRGGRQAGHSFAHNGAKWHPQMIWGGRFGSMASVNRVPRTRFFCMLVFYVVLWLHLAPKKKAASNLVALIFENHRAHLLSQPILFGHSIKFCIQNKYHHQMCPLHIPPYNDVHLHIPLILPFWNSKDVGIPSTFRLMYCDLPLSAFGVLIPTCLRVSIPKLL